MNTLIYFLLLLLVLFIMVFALFLLVQALINHPPFVPSNQRNILKAFDKYKLGVEHSFIDLGSGDGRVVISASRRGANATGIEINPFLVWWSKIISGILGRNVRFKLGSYWNEDLSQYNFLFVYLYPEVVRKLEEKIFTTMPAGSIVVSNTFEFNRQPIERIGRVAVYMV